MADRSKEITTRSLPTVVRLQGSPNLPICVYRRSGREAQKVMTTHQRTGRPSDIVWQYFERLGASKTGPHYIARCNFCHIVFGRGKAGILRKHLAYDCKNVSNECRGHFLELVTMEAVNQQATKKRKGHDGEATLLSSLVELHQPFKNPDVTNDPVDKELIRLLVTCNLPFSIVHNPVFSSFIRKLRPDYLLPSKSQLSGKLLWEEASSVTQRTEMYLKQQQNLTLIIDGWTEFHQNVYAFIIMTSDRRAFLNSLQCFSDEQNIADFLIAEMEKIITNIGPDKIAALVTENSQNMPHIEKVREYLLQKYPYILNLRNIPHYLNLITGDILKHIWAQEILKKCQTIVSFFIEHDRLSFLLKKCRDNPSVPELTGMIKCHWYSIGLSIKSVLKNEHALQRICASRGADIPIEIRDIISDQEFWTNVEQLSKVTRPLVKVIALLESNNATLADCYQQLICLAAAINDIHCNSVQFQNHCKAAYISRWDELNDAIYILAYFLHPSIRGKGVVQAMFSAMLEVAGNLWKRSRHGKASTMKLLSQLVKFKKKSEPYDVPLTSEWLTPLLWWETVDNANTTELKTLATKLLSITSHLASYEPALSIFNWIRTKAKNQLNINRLEAMAKIYIFNMSHGSKSEDTKIPPIIIDQFADPEIIDADEGIIYVDQDGITADNNAAIEFAMSNDYFQVWEKLSETFDLQGEIFNTTDEITGDDGSTPEAIVEVILPENDTDFEIQDVLASFSAENTAEHAYLEYFE